jgi:hypothetical protein
MTRLLAIRDGPRGGHENATLERPFAILLAYFLVGLLGHYLNMTFIRQVS